MSSIYVAIELGTTRTVLAVGEGNPGDRLKLTSLAEIPSSGVRKSQIVDINQVTQSVRAVLHEVENRKSGDGDSVMIGNAYLIVSGQHVKTSRHQGSAQIGSHKVTDSEIEEANHDAHQMTLPRERELLDIIDQDYELDGRGGISSPKGMSGTVLHLNTLQIHADHDRLEDARTATEAAHLEISEPIYAITCAAEAVLEDHEKRNGVIVIDFGGGSTGYAVHCDGTVVATRVIGVGGDHVTNDIAHAFQTTQAQAEELKIHESSALITAGDRSMERVKIPGSSPLIETRTVSRHALDTVVNARLRELAAIIREDLEEQGLLHRLHAGIVITGGGAAQRDLDALLQRELGMNVRPGRPLHVDGIDTLNDGRAFQPAYAAVCGALMYAQRNDDGPGFFGNIFGGIFR